MKLENISKDLEVNNKQLNEWLSIRELIERVNGNLNPILVKQHCRKIIDGINHYQRTYNIRFNYTTYQEREF